MRSARRKLAARGICYNRRMPDTPSTVRVPRAWVFMVMGASVLGATLAAIVMINVLSTREGEGARHEAARLPQNAPANEPANAPLPPPADTQPQPPPVKPPPVRREPPVETPPPPPPPAEETVRTPSTNCVRRLPPQAAFRVKPKGGVWRDGAADTVFAAGDRLRVTTGQVEFDVFGSRVIGATGADFSIDEQPGAAAFTLLVGGVYFMAQDAQQFFRLALPQQSVVTRGALFFARADAVSSELELVEGEARVIADVPDPDLGPVAFAIGSQARRHDLAATRCAEIEEVFLPAREVLLRWNFDAGSGPCTLGRYTTRGFRGTGALETAPQFAAIGADSDVRFVPGASSRLHLRIKTNARQVRVSFVSGTGAQATTWSITVDHPPQDVWTLHALDLAGFHAEGKGVTFAGQTCHSLQFRMRFDERDARLPSERFLTIDDVELFTPK